MADAKKPGIVDRDSTAEGTQGSDTQGRETTNILLEERKRDAKLDKLLKGTRISSRHYNSIDPYTWCEPVCQTSSSLAITTYVVRFLTEWEEFEVQGEDLFFNFREEFNNWTVEMFEKIKSPFKREFRDYLHHHGVHTGKRTIALGPAMTKLLEAEVCPLDPQGDEGLSQSNESPEIRVTTATPTSSDNQTQPPRNQPRPSYTHLSPPPQLQPYTQARNLTPHFQQRPQQSHQQPQMPYHPHFAQQTHNQSQRPIRQSSPNIWEIHQPHFTPNSSYPQQPTVAASLGYRDFDDYSCLPPRDVPSERVDVNTQTSFIKLWDRSMSYTGEAYDLLDDKVRNFLRICYNLNVQPQYFHGLFNHILAGEAQAFYLNYIPKDDTFYGQYTKIKFHFDTEINHHKYYTDWTSVTFENFREKMPEKSLQEVLDAFLKKKQLCQRALGDMYAGESLLRTQVITNCKGVPIFDVALFNPGKSCEELFSQLRSAIELHTNRKQHAQFQQYGEDQGESQFFLDRKYNQSRQSRYRNGYKFEDGGNRGEASRDTRQPQKQLSRGASQRQWKKKCFICGKEGCWSTKHQRNEFNRAKTQYVAQCNFKGDEPNFAVYLAEYEGIDEEESQPDEEQNEDTEDEGFYQTS